MAETGEAARSSFDRTGQYRRRSPPRRAPPAGTTIGPLQAGRSPCRAAAGLGNPQNTPEKQSLRPVPQIPPPHPSRPPPVESEDHDRFSTSAVCHQLLHPITLPPADRSLDNHLILNQNHMRPTDS